MEQLIVLLLCFSRRERVQAVSGRLDASGTQMFPVQCAQGRLDQQPVPLPGTGWRCGHSQDRGGAGFGSMSRRGAVWSTHPRTRLQEELVHRQMLQPADEDLSPAA